jgi:hypothetical protein
MDHADTIGAASVRFGSFPDVVPASSSGSLTPTSSSLSLVSTGVPSSASPRTVVLRYFSSGTRQSRDELVLAFIDQGKRNEARHRASFSTGLFAIRPVEIGTLVASWLFAGRGKLQWRMGSAAKDRGIGAMTKLELLYAQRSKKFDEICALASVSFQQ